LLFIKGLSFTYPIHAALLLLITPILITIIASLVLKEKITSFKIIGLLLGVSGAMVLILSKEKTGNATDVFIGDILIIVNAISYTFYFVLVKPLMKEYNPIAILRMVFTIGFFMILPFCYKEFSIMPWQYYDTKEILALTLIVLGGTFFAYLFNIYGIKVLGASTAGAYIYSQPLFAAAIAMSFLGEDIAAYKIIAGLLIFAGVFIANKQININGNNNSL
jgi:drug/metabolite transporter (DMT)-like permease